MVHNARLFTKVVVTQYPHRHECPHHAKTKNNSSVAKQEIESEMWLVANSGGRSAEESGGIEFCTEFSVTERAQSRWID